MAKPEKLEDFPKGTFYAKLDNELAVQDFGDGLLCVRLVAVSRKSFDTQAFNEGAGCETYILDIPLDDYLSAWFPKSYRYLARPNRALMSELQLVGLTYELGRLYEGEEDWLKIDFEESTDAFTSYAYTAFREEEPTFLRVLTIAPMSGPPILPAPPLAPTYSFPVEAPHAITSLTAFHVGQGMCSLVAGDSVGYLLDAGAGTPLKKGAYQRRATRSGKSLVNDLADATASLRLVAIISHPDSDHWRLLEWDAALAAKVEAILVPTGTANLALSSPLTKKKVFGLADQSIPFSVNSVIEVARSQRKKGQVTTNTNGLVVTVEVAGKTALIPGDYVYDEMPFDGHLDIANIPKKSFDAVVVPHHGDKASAKDVPAPKIPAQSVAFFSAGDNLGYGHPTMVSKDAHQKKGYKNVVDNFCEDIIGVKLLP